MEPRDEHNDPRRSKGESDPLFQSQSEHAFRFGHAASADPRYAGKQFDEVERDLEGDWLNVRVAGGDWQAARVDARQGFERGRQIGIAGGGGVIGDSVSHERASYSDPIAGNIDPTAPDSPEQQP